MVLNIDAKFEEKLTCALKNDMRNLANFHSLKNSDFILESRVAEIKLSNQMVFFRVQYIYFQDMMAALRINLRIL